MTDLTVATIRPERTDLQREYVAGSDDYWLSAFRQAVRALPHYVDTLEAELGDDSYQRMLNDPQVESSVDLLKAAILEDSISLNPAQTEDGDEAGAAQAAEMLAFVRRTIDNLTTPLEDVLWDMLDALAYGARIAELVYTMPPTGDDAGRYVLTAIKPKPREVLAFVVDVYLNVIGFLANRPGQARRLIGVHLNDEQRRSLLSPDKFAVLTWRPRNSDPRGRTVLRAAYNAWWIKTQALPEFLKLLVQFATPSVYGTTSPDAVGNPETGESPEDLLLKALINIQNGSAAALPPDTVLGTIEAGKGGAEAFDIIIELLNREITKGILGQTRATMEAKNGSKADSETGKELFDTLVRAGQRTVARMLQRDVVDRLIALNFGNNLVPLAPVITVGVESDAERSDAWSAAASLERSGYLDPSQYQQLDALLGLAPRTPAEIDARRTKRNAPTPAPVLPQAAPDDDDENEES
jgi:hypothetical protein